MPWTDQIVFLREGLRLGLGLLRPQPVRRFPGTADAICRAVVEECWNGTYFRAGATHLDQFWLRDLAICLEGLIDLGHADRARSCLDWALSRYEAAGRVTTTIFGHRRCADVYTYACDSLPFLLYGLLRLEARDLVQRYRRLLEAEAGRYAAALIDPASGLVRTDRMYSAVKDTTHFTGTCTASAMAAWCAALLERAGLPCPLHGEALRRSVVERFWTGTFFRNDVHTEPPLCSADANFWPYWCELLDEPAALLPKSVEAVRAHGLDAPMPLKYHAQRMPGREVPVQRLMLPNYQGDAIWTFFTPQWIGLAGTVDSELAARYVAQYCAWIEREGTWIEVFEPDGSRPLAGRLGFGAEHGMLWAASMPRLIRQYAPQKEAP